jgi:hypothetical protein
MYDSCSRSQAGRPPAPLSPVIRYFLMLRKPVVMRGSGLRAPGSIFPLGKLDGGLGRAPLFPQQF